jgi:arylsulfatase A-like enzyme
VRFVAPAGTTSTAGLPRVQIGRESRFVLHAHPGIWLRTNEPVEVPQDGELRVEVTLPPSLAGTAARVDAWYSVRDPDAPARTMVEMREGRRLTVRAAPVVVAAGATPPAAALPVPDAARGLPARLTVTARALPPAVETWTTDEVTVAPGTRLDFGYAVEEPGWSEGWPPARFAVAAVPAGGGAPVPLLERRLDPAADPRDRRWFDASVDLASIAGRRVRFAFTVEALAAGTGAAVDRTFGVVSNPTLTRAGDGRPNVVLISLDTLRAKSVGAYGHPRPTTPALDARLAARGALVRAAVAPIPFTPPSHLTLFTGLEPCMHGLIDVRDRPLAADRPTLPEALRAAGWHTAAFTENGYLIGTNGFERGFDVYVENRAEESASPGFAAETFGAAADWLAASPSARPFFLFVHTYQVHEPYTPPRGYRTLWADGDVQDPNRRSLDDYEREVRYLDDVLAGFLDVLDAHGLAERTMVVATSDHGEGFGEHFWGGHGFHVNDEAILVPLVIRAPGVVPAGRVIEEQVGLVDVAPTVLDLLGLPPLPGASGRSFARLLTGRGAPFEERPLVSAALFSDGVPGTETVRTRTHKYLRVKDQEMVYDLQADPGETRPVADAGALAAGRAALAAARAECERWRAEHPRTEPTDAAPADKPGWMVNREEMERKLRSLGYVR